MFEAPGERVASLRKINCWEFIGCGREFGGNRIAEAGLCPAAVDISADRINSGKNGGRICWAVAGTFSGGKMDGLYAKKILSCRSCKFFKNVKEEEGGNFSLFVNKKAAVEMAEAAPSF